MRVDGPALGWTDLVGAIRRTLDGERDVNTFLDGLDSEASMILAGLTTRRPSLTCSRASRASERPTCRIREASQEGSTEVVALGATRSSTPRLRKTIVVWWPASFESLLLPDGITRKWTGRCTSSAQVTRGMMRGH